MSPALLAFLAPEAALLGGSGAASLGGATALGAPAAPQGALSQGLQLDPATGVSFSPDWKRINMTPGAYQGGPMQVASGDASPIVQQPDEGGARPPALSMPSMSSPDLSRPSGGYTAPRRAALNIKPLVQLQGRQRLGAF